MVYHNKIQFSQEQLDLLKGSVKKKNEEGDQNFISDRDGNKNKKPITPINATHRGLDNETGGLEIDYEQESKDIEDSANKDAWDQQSNDVVKMASESDHQDQEDNKLFIHAIKTRVGRKGKKGKGMGQVDLGEADDMDDEMDGTMVQKIKKLRQDRGHEGGGGQGISF